jgi:hypothetical protein
MATVELATGAIRAYSDGGTCRKWSIDLDAGTIRAWDPVAGHFSVCHALTPRQQAGLVRRAQAEYWQSLIPSDLRFGTFKPRFKLGNRTYKFGAWNGSGVPWLYWNTTAELFWQLSQLED